MEIQDDFNSIIFIFININNSAAMYEQHLLFIAAAKLSCSDKSLYNIISLMILLYKLINIFKVFL